MTNLHLYLFYLARPFRSEALGYGAIGAPKVPYNAWIARISSKGPLRPGSQRRGQRLILSIAMLAECS
jgi:hypothetical protein